MKFWDAALDNGPKGTISSLYIPVCASTMNFDFVGMASVLFRFISPFCFVSRFTI